MHAGYRPVYGALALGALLLAGVASAQPATSLVPDGKAPELELLYTGDVIGYLDPCG